MLNLARPSVLMRIIMTKRRQKSLAFRSAGPVAPHVSIRRSRMDRNLQGPPGGSKKRLPSAKICGILRYGRSA
jgi:hypothetical protein